MATVWNILFQRNFWCSLTFCLPNWSIPLHMNYLENITRKFSWTKRMVAKKFALNVTQPYPASRVVFLPPWLLTITKSLKVVTDCDMPSERLWKCLKKAMQERNLCSQRTQPVIPLSYKLIQCSPCIMLYQLYLLLHEYLSSPFQILLSPPNKVFHLVSCLSLHFLV